MGMYSVVVEDNIYIEDEEAMKAFRSPYRSPIYSNGQTRYVTYHYDGEWLYGFLKEGEEIKFYGYWDAAYLRFLDKLAQKGLVEGTCVVRYEDDSIPLILCKFDKKGFNFKYAQKPNFDTQPWERKTVVKPHKREGKPVRGHTRKKK